MASHISSHPKKYSALEHWNGLLKNGLKNISDSISLTLSWSTHLSKAVWLLNMAVPRKGSSSLGYSMERTGGKIVLEST